MEEVDMTPREMLQHRITQPSQYLAKGDDSEPDFSIGKVLHFDRRTKRLVDDLANVRVMVIDSDFYKGLRDELFNTFKSGATIILYQMGIGYGLLTGSKISQSSSTISASRKFMRRGEYQGYGQLEVPLLGSIISGIHREVVVRLKDSFYATSAGQTGQVECYLTAGMIAGAATILLKKKFKCVEEKCLSKGDEYCEFRLKEEG